MQFQRLFQDKIFYTFNIISPFKNIDILLKYVYVFITQKRPLLLKRFKISTFIKIFVILKLNYIKTFKKLYKDFSLVRLEGLEPPICKFVACHSIQLNYRRIFINLNFWFILIRKPLYSVFYIFSSKIYFFYKKLLTIE